MASGVPVNGLVCEGGGVTEGKPQTCSVLAESLGNNLKAESVVSSLFFLLELQTYSSCFYSSPSCPEKSAEG